MARDRNTGKGAPINRLLPQTDFEQELFEAADARAAAKKAERSLPAAAKAEAAQQRQAEVDAMMTAARPFFSLPALAPKHTFPMARTKLTNTLITEPQHQNTAGRVFGGFLMRRAFELAFACCYVFVRQRHLRDVWRFRPANPDTITNHRRLAPSLTSWLWTT